jgi:hypothetical protein
MYTYRFAYLDHGTEAAHKRKNFDIHDSLVSDTHSAQTFCTYSLEVTTSKRDKAITVSQ